MHGYFSAEKFLVLAPVALARHPHPCVSRGCALHLTDEIQYEYTKERLARHNGPYGRQSISDRPCPRRSRFQV